MSTSPLTFRLARPDEGPAVAAFLDAHWGEKHPLVHLPDFFDFYYRPFGPDGPLQFAFAEQDGAPVAIVGYIRANALETPDIWVSIWCAVKGHNGSGLELMAALPGLTNARVMACNNIRPRTMAFYTFLGYTAERLPHYYRLADKASYAVARVARRDILPAGGSAVLRLLPDEDALRKCCYTPDPARRPYKDLWYLARRYFHYPRQRYDVWAVEECGAVQALLATRCIPVNGTCVLRIVDYTGVPEAFSRLGAAVSRLMADCGAEYADCYCWGIPAQTMAEAGFCARTEDDLNIIPNYLTPPLCENTEYYFFTSEPAAFTMFKADGDQDRPNIRVE